MTAPLVYGSTALGVLSPDMPAELRAEFVRFIKDTFSLADLIPFQLAPPRPTLATIAWPTPWDHYARHPQVRLNTLHWPVGASRWAWGCFLVSEQDLAAIRAEAYADGTYQALTLTLDDGSDDYAPVETDLWMLPAIPIAPQKVIYAEDGTALLDTSGLKKWMLPRALAADGTEAVYILPLVDERYFWWNKAANITVNDDVTTWSTLFSSIASALGITLTVDTVAAAYLKPAGGFSSYHQYLPVLLDAVAASVGQRVVRKLDGSVVTQSASTAITSLEAQLALDYPRIGGGLLALDRNSTNLTATARQLSTDWPGVLPASVAVAFPRTDDGAFTEAPHTVNVTLTSLALSEFADAVTNVSVKILRSSCVAAYTTAGGGTATNDTELTALAVQIATDWYRWQCSKASVAFAGSVPWVVDGSSDSVEWTWETPLPRTRVLRPPFNRFDGDWIGLHYGDGGAIYNYFTDLYVTNLYVTNVNGGDSCVAVHGEANDTLDLTSDSWEPVPGTEVEITVGSEATAKLDAAWEFDGNDTANVTYDGAGAGSVDTYEGRFVIDGVPTEAVARCSLSHPAEVLTIDLPPELVTLPAGTYNVRQEARRAGATGGQAITGLNTRWTLISACSGGGVGPNITVNNLVVNNYYTYAPYSVTLTTNTTNFTINSSVTLVNLTANVEITNILFSRTFLDGDQITIINTSTAYFLTLKITGNIESYSLTEVTIGPNMVLKLTYVSADVTIPRVAGLKLYKEPCWHQPYRPSQITSNQASYALAWSATYFDLDFDANRTIYGFANYYSGRLFFFFNRSDFTVTIPHNSSSAGTAAQRVYTQNGQNCYIGTNQGAWFQYDGIAQRWRQLTGQVRYQMSITEDAAGLKLVNDEEDPGSFRYYGTPLTSNTKGWWAFPTPSQQSGLEWVKVTKTYTDMAAANTTSEVTVYTLDAKEMVHGAIMKTTAAFGGGGIASYSLDLGDSTSATGHINGYDATQFNGTNWGNAGAKVVHGATGSNDLTATMAVKLRATSTGANLDQATAGSVEIWLLVSTLP